MGGEANPGAFGGELALSEGLRDELGLDPTEAIRVLHAGSHALLLERACSSSPVAIPWDRDLVLTASVRAFPLADILSMIHDSCKSGFLYFRQGDHEKAVYLHRGEVVFASSNVTLDRLGECMLRAGIITLEQLRDAERTFSPPERFGKVLVQRGILTPRALWNGVKAQVEEIVRSLFAYTTGLVHFWEGEVQPDNVVRLSLPTRRLIAEGLERRDELFKLLAVLEDPRVTLQSTGGATHNLAANESSFLEAVSGETSFQAVCRSVGLDPLSGARTLQLLSLMGAVRVDRSGRSGERAPEGAATPSPDDEIRACVLDHVKLLAELAAPIVAIDGSQKFGQRLQSVIDDTAQRHPELLADIELASSCVLDPELLGARAVRLRGERRVAVCQALGEIVSYVEFELRNHPTIQEPEHFLEAVQHLRSNLDI